jgi:MFS family permease
VAIVTYFAVLGVAVGVWLARIPAVKQNLHLSDGMLGVALLASPVGLVLAAAFADRLIERFGSARLTVTAGVAFPLVPIALGLAGSLPDLMAALLAYGMIGGATDVAMNSQAVRVERGYRRPLISSFHASFSVGGLLGALLGGMFAWAGVGPALTFTAVGVPLAAAASLARRGLLRGPDHQVAADQVAGGQEAVACSAHQDAGDQQAAGHAGGQEGAAHRSSPSLRIAALGLLALCCLLAEGAAGSWSAVYLRDNLGTSAAFAALGYAAFSVMMAAGRLCGDRLAARFGPSRLVSGCGLVAAVGLAAGLIIARPAAGLIGFALLGVGLSSTFPLLVSAAGNINTARPGAGIARVVGAGYLGELGGPVLIGTCASLIGLRLALGIPVVLMLFVAAGGRVVRAGGAGG